MPFAEYAFYAQDTYSLPNLCTHLRQILDDPSSDVKDIARCIEVDAALTSKLLRLANSSLFRFPREVASIDKAINIVGGEAVYNLVMAETAQKAVFAYHNKLIDPTKHWEKSVLMGVLTKQFAKAHVRGAERFFLLGLMFHLGEMVIAQHSPDAYSAYLSDDSESLPAVLQMLYFKADFALISGGILEEWGLPLSLYGPLMDAHSSMTTKPLDEKLLIQAEQMLWVFANPDIAEQRFDKASALHHLQLQYADALEIYEATCVESAAIYSLF